MKIAIYARPDIRAANATQMERLEAAWLKRGWQVDLLSDAEEGLEPDTYRFVLSVGGDGTMLSAVHAMGSVQVPVVGINWGHLGFLTTVGRDDVDHLVDDLCEGRYTVEERTLLHVAYGDTKDKSAFALNEVSVHRGFDEALLHTRLYVDGEYVATYDADGLMVATPTGSTAYSLSCGGPILTPNSGCFVITPIAAHKLTLRPMIVPDDAQIRLVSETRSPSYRLAIDSELETMAPHSEIALSREHFKVRLVRMDRQSFYSAIREKLSWGR